MYIVGNVQEAENVGILACQYYLPFSLLIPDFERVNSGTGREWKKSIPEIREREGNKKIHSQISGMGRE